MAKAIEVYEATLITPGAPFDIYLSGEAGALNRDEKEGLKLFMDKGCSGCHGGINMGGSGYFLFGVVERPADKITAGDKGRLLLPAPPQISMYLSRHRLETLP